MSFSDHGRIFSSRARARLAVCVLALALAACTVRPVYTPASGGGSSVQAAMASIAIDPVDDRVAQVVRNRLMFQLTGGGPPANPTYRMRLNVTDRRIGLGLTSVEDAPVYSINVSATYTLTRIDGGDVVLRNTAKATASYNTVNQAFANTRARRDAEDRAANSVANDIAIRVAAAVSNGL